MAPATRGPETSPAPMEVVVVVAPGLGPTVPLPVGAAPAPVGRRLVAAVVVATRRSPRARTATAGVVGVGGAVAGALGHGVRGRPVDLRRCLPLPPFRTHGHRTNGIGTATYGPSGGRWHRRAAALVTTLGLVADVHSVTAVAATGVTGRGSTRGPRGGRASVAHRGRDPGYFL